jgi:acetolactate synthase-1/2/3 large subunit
LIDLPKNVQTDRGEVNFSKEIRVRGYHPQREPHPLQVKKAVKMLREAERPTVLAGGGVIIANAARDLLELAKLLMMPVTTTFMGKGAFPENHPLSLGTIGMHGTHVANKLILEADVLLAVGTRFSDRTTGTLDTFCPDAKIIQIDIDAAEIGKNVKINVPIVADARDTLRLMHQLLLETKNLKPSPWFRRVKAVRDQLTSENDPNSAELNPPRLIKALRKILPSTAIVTTEVGQNQMWAAIHFQTLKPRTFISSGGLGTMGFGFPAALGAKVACPKCAVVDIAGDGSFRMTEQELGCSITEHIPVTVIVLNNSMLGMVAQWQRMFFDHRYSAVKLGNTPDFVKLAEAYGAQGIRVGSLKEFSRAMHTALKSEVTTVLDVPISPEENVFPMVPAGKGLKDMILG